MYIPKEKSTKGIALFSLNNLLKRKKIWLNPEYQRESVWTKSQKQLFIDSILSEIDIPKLYFHRSPDKRYDYQVIDGQQRLRAVSDFFNGEFKLSSESEEVDGEKIAGLKFEELSSDLQTKFEGSNLDIVILNTSYTEKDIEEMFSRLQNGSPLNAAEKRRAYHGNMKHVVINLGKHKIFELCGFSSIRYAFEDAAAKILHIILHGSITDITQTKIKITYKNNEDIEDTHLQVKKLKRTFNFIYESFKDLETPKFRKYAIITISILINEMLTEYNLKKHQSNLGKIWLDFEDKRKKNMKLPEEDQDSVLVNFTNAARSDSIGEMKFRHDTLKREILKKIPDLEPLDSKRYFTEEQRHAIYQKFNGKCCECGEVCDKLNFQIDHKIPYIKGGKTTLSNAQLTHPNCNQKKGAT